MADMNKTMTVTKRWTEVDPDTERFGTIPRDVFDVNGPKTGDLQVFGKLSMKERAKKVGAKVFT